MARQKGIIKLKVLGDITFTKLRSVIWPVKKGGIDASRIANDPAFQRTRENGSEFGRAGKAGKSIANCFESFKFSGWQNEVLDSLNRW
jgi:hypothetical protein